MSEAIEGGGQNDKERARANLWRCSCVDNGDHTNPDYHQSRCDYIVWLKNHNIDLEDNNEEE